MINLRSNTSTNSVTSSNDFLLCEEYEPVFKKLKVGTEDCSIQHIESYPHSHVPLRIPSNPCSAINASSLSEKNVIYINSESCQEDSCESTSLWLEVLEDATETGNTKMLVKLLQEGLLNDLDAEGNEEIASFGLVYNKREILLECANKGFSADTHLDVLKHASDFNDFELAQAVCKGEKGVPSQSNWCKDPFLTINGYKDSGTDSRITDLLSSYFSLNAAKIEEHDWRKYLAGLWNINGFFKLCNQKLEYQGAHIHQFIDRILSTFQPFRIKNPNAINDELLTTLFKLVDESRVSISDDEKLKIFKANEPIMVHAGFSDHHMEVVLWNDYLLICNKGSLSEMPVKAYLINPNLVKVELFQKIRECSDTFSEEKANDFFATSLPNMVNGVEHLTMNTILTENWIDENLHQNGENCVWESLRTALFGVAALDAWIRNDCENSLFNVFKQHTISNGLKQLLPWDQYVGLFSLRQYVDYSVKDPSQMDRKLALVILRKAKELMQKGKVDYLHYEKVLGKFIHVRAKAIEIENSQF